MKIKMEFCGDRLPLVFLGLGIRTASVRNATSMPLKIYAYEKCGTCRKALKFLDTQGIDYLAIPILEHPPHKAELKRMLKLHDGEVRRLFNTSGREYNRLKLKEKLPGLAASEAIDLLAHNGRLVRRPFLLAGTRGGVVGFNEAGWKDLLK